MGIGLNIITSPETSKWVQDSAFQVLSEGALKTIGRPAFTLADKSAEPEAKRYSACKEVIFQTLSMVAYFAVITTIFQKLGYKAMKNLPKFKDFEALKDLKKFEDFSHTFDSYVKGKIKTIAKEADQLEKAKGGMELIKMVGSGVILTILCPMFVTKLVHPIMNTIMPKDADKKTQTENKQQLKVNA